MPHSCWQMANSFQSQRVLLRRGSEPYAPLPSPSSSRTRTTTGIERAYIEHKLSSKYGPLNPVRDDSYAWRTELELFRSSKRWQIIARLAGDDGQALEDSPNMFPVIEEVINQFVTVATAPVVVAPGRCTATTRAKKPCRRNAQPGKQTCASVLTVADAMGHDGAGKRRSTWPGPVGGNPGNPKWRTTT